MKSKKTIKITKKLILWIPLIMALFTSIIFVGATPPLPTEFYGKVRSFNQDALAGTVISVYDSEGNLCGSYRMQVNGYFGVLTCRGEDNMSLGPEENELLTFKINNQIASTASFVGYTRPLSNTTNVSYKNSIYTRSNVTWQSGLFKDILISIPPLVCGDDYCDSLENCFTCSEDCGACPEGGQTGSNNTENAQGGSGGGGGGSFGEGEEQFGYEFDESAAPGYCEEEWVCGDWQECTPFNYQLRDCADVNDCGTSYDMPLISQECIYEYDELIDENRTSSNASYIPPRKETPALISICRDRLPIFSLQSLLFMFLLILIMVIAEFDYRKKIKRIMSDKELDELKKLELKYLEQRKRYIFVIVLFVIAVVVYLYHYFFLLCKDKYIKHLWLLLVGVIFMPIIVHIFLAMSRFSESQKNKHLFILNDAHYKHVVALLKIANDQLISSEKIIVSKIYVLEQRDEFNALLLKNKIVEKIYLDMSKLFNLYKTLNNPMSIEKDLLENIRKLDQDAEFLEASKLHPELSSLRSELSMIYSAYESKQELYDELAKMEKEYKIKEDLVR